MKIINYQNGNTLTRKIVDAFNIYVKKGEKPSVEYKSFNYSGSIIHYFKVKPSDSTMVNLDFSNDYPKYITEIKNDYMLNNGWELVGGINGAYFDNHSGAITYGMPVGAVLTNWGTEWQTYKGQPCYPCKDKGYPTVYSNGYDLKYIDGWDSDFSGLMGNMLWARGLGQSLTFNGAINCNIGSQNGRYNSKECVSMIGITKAGEWLLVINTVTGLNHLTRAYLMESLGAYASFDLDGGGSTHLFYEPSLINETTSDDEPTDEPTNEPNEGDNMLRGIDISNWQKGINLGKMDADFIIVKATEGIGYVDPTCDGFFQEAKRLGKKIGFYHFARPSNDAITEAEFFYNNTKNYFKQAIPILDWEVEPKGNVAWAKEWLDRVYQLSGVKPLIYMSESVVNSYNWQEVVNGDYGLWVAKYRDNIIDYNYNMSSAGNAPSVKYWKGYAMWQWTSSGRLDGYNDNLDCNVFYGNLTAWDKYAGVEKQEQPTDTGDTGGTNEPTVPPTDTGNTGEPAEDTKSLLEKIIELLKKLLALLTGSSDK